MKFLRVNFKQVLKGFFAVAVLSVASPAYAQLPAITNDLQAYNSAGIGKTILNTGTDIFSYNEDERLKFFIDNFKVMVWDGDQPGLSWVVTDLDGNKTEDFISIRNIYRDPDVVVHQYNGEIYAMVVYESHEGQIQYDSYKWNGGSFNYHDGSVVGNNNPGDVRGAKRLSGENPNIDVNSEGKVVVTWHESFSYPASTTILLPGNNQTFHFDVVRSEIYAVFGNIDGSRLSGVSSQFNGLQGTTIDIDYNSTSPRGDKISVTGNLLYEHNKYPDVALSEQDVNGELAVTFTYSKMSFLPLFFSTDKKWVIDQRILNTTGSPSLTTGFFTGNAQPNSGTYRPRIASRKIFGTYARDFEAVTGPVHRGCDETGFYTYSAIYNFGRFNNVTHPVTTVNSGYTDTENYEPVVSYRYNEFGRSGQYVVAWTINTNFGPAHQRNLNIMAATMRNGARQGSQLAWVNKGNYAPDSEDEPFVGNQLIPSIAGSYSNVENQYMFVDLEEKHNNDVKYKGSENKPGTVQLRQTQGGTSNGFTAFPNPFSDEVRFNLQIDATDAPQTLTLLDLTGRQLDKLEIKHLKPGNNTLTWQSRKPLPAGVYLARLQSREKITTIRIVKQ
ncbi:T9SS type A sorting domain-containing protein [Adhaeribacter soli]|uniref:T9SS type A sorting domain-containing protein n=1 Tax=Adhaeribacter soli TaxID=2607655 RepID=A0A5N1IUJ3_9BACT|nr:T9SS type A sorting domain-containing protein [Adhaeribacter soli]KAA9333690.1 T9SS type A sorting domain-containing protein [Adhaeribacter soli]